MGVFWTERNVENWLEPESRVLLLPDGTTHAVTGRKLMWELHDELLRSTSYSAQQFIQWALEECNLSGLSLDRTFEGVIAFVDRETRWKRSESHLPQLD
jgi:hypothetical protein